MLSVVHLSGADLIAPARVALGVLAARPGFVAGRLGRSTDDPSDWVLVTRWENVGAYRRALGNYEVKLHATPLLAQAIELPSSFEELLTVDADGTTVEHSSDRASG